MTDDIKDGETVCKHGSRPFECVLCHWESTKEYKAYKTLEENFTETRGIYHKKDFNYKPTKEEWEAIDYLCDEWDYGYEE